MARFDVSKLAKASTSALSVAGYRNQVIGFDPRSGEGARRFGGRFNPPHSFPVIYLCTSRPCVVAELTGQAQRQGLTADDLLPREVWRITVELTKVLDLTRRDTLKALAVDPADLVRDDLQLTNEIGEAAHEHGWQSIRSASATGDDDVLAIIPDNLASVVLLAELIEVWRTASELP